MEYLKGWRVMREDPEWMRKTFFVGLSMFVPVLGPIVVTGWSALILRRAVSGQDAPLPRFDFDFDYLGKLLNVGFKGFLASLLWSLPMVGLIMVFYCCIYGGGMVLMGGVMAGGEAGGGEGAAAVGIIGMLFIGVAFLFLMVAMVVLTMMRTVGYTRAEVADDVNVALKLKETWDMTRMLVMPMFIAAFVFYFVALAGSLVASFTLCLAYPSVLGVMVVLGAHYRAELYKVYLQKGGEPLPIGPLSVEGGDVPQQPHQQGGNWGPPPAQF